MSIALMTLMALMTPILTAMVMAMVTVEATTIRQWDICTIWRI